MNTRKKQDIEEILDQEIEEAEKEFEAKKREEDTKQIILHQKDLLSARHTIYDVIKLFDIVERKSRNKIVCLDHEYIIRGLTRSVRRVLKYRQKDEIPFIGKPYTDLVEKKEVGIMETKFKYENKFEHQILVPNKKGKKSSIDSTVLGYLKTRKNKLLGVILYWEKLGWF